MDDTQQINSSDRYAKIDYPKVNNDIDEFGFADDAQDTDEDIDDNGMWLDVSDDDGDDYGDGGDDGDGDGGGDGGDRQEINISGLSAQIVKRLEAVYALESIADDQLIGLLARDLNIRVDVLTVSSVMTL